MFLRSAFFGTSLLALCSGMAMASPATPEEAARLLGVIQTYLGSEPGLVTVEPAGDNYTVTFDLAPIIAKASPDVLKGTVSPYVTTLTDNGDGTWNTVSDQAFSAKFVASSVADISYTIGSWKSTGVFDEKLGAFSMSRSEFGDLAMTQTMTLPDLPPSNSTVSAADGVYESVGAAGIAGGVDIKATFAFIGFLQTMDLPGPVGAAPSQATITAENYLGDATMKAFDPAAFYKLVAWFVEHPSKEAITADQAELKTLLADGMPFFQNAASTLGLNNVTVATPTGDFKIASVALNAQANGLVDAGLVREGVTLSGLTLPEGLAPAWSQTLLPRNMSFDIGLSGFNAAAPAAVLIAALDMTRPDLFDPATQGALANAFMPDGTVDITLAPGAISSDLYNLTYEGAMTAGPNGAPMGKAKVTMTGMNAVMAALQAAPPEVAGQFTPMLTLAQGMAQPGVDGALVWEIDATTPGTLLVNGVNVMAMMGGQ